jgi:D-sedoheptulose 7-phosphate isomerase
MADEIGKTLLEGYFSRLAEGLKAIPIDALLELGQTISRVRNQGKTVWICGNGGSAATSSHMQVDLSFGVLPGVKARALNENSASITATGNDVAFEEIFARQIALEGVEGDLLLVISASGNSKNLLRAVEEAKAKRITTAGLVGFDGGKLKNLVDLVIHTPTKIGDYGVAEDLHACVNHAIKELLNKGLR